MSNTSNPRLSALKIVDPSAWRAEIRAALKAEGSVPGAAVVLNVSRATLFRWLAEDEALRDGVQLPDKPGPRATKST